MKKVDLRDFGPVISDKEIGSQIYTLLNLELEKGEQIEVDLEEIKSMATFCARQIFGALYLKLGPAEFFDKVILKNANNDIRTIIKIGIQHAISGHNES